MTLDLVNDVTMAAEKSVRIVVVEDNPADVHLIREALVDRKINFQLEAIGDGESALQRFSSGDAADIVLLDLNLPKVGGDAILNTIRGNRKFDGVPIVVLTSSDSPKDRSQAESSGASAFIRKPSNLDEFLAIGSLVQQLTSENA